MKFLGNNGLAYLIAILMLGGLSLAQATPYASRIHDANLILEEVPVDEPLTKAEKKALRKEKRAEKKAQRAAMVAEQAANGQRQTGWRNVFVPGFGYQLVYFDSFGYPSHDILGRPIFANGFGSPYFYRRAPRRVIVAPRCRVAN